MLKKKFLPGFYPMLIEEQIIIPQQCVIKLMTSMTSSHIWFCIAVSRLLAMLVK